jgi:hypothetical protein
LPWELQRGEWSFAAGPSYSYTEFETVQSNQSASASTPVATLQSYLKADITKRLKLIHEYRGSLTTKEAGQYSDHDVSTREFEIKHHLNLDVSFIWDYLRYLQTENNGDVPKRSDYCLTVGLGVNF